MYEDHWAATASYGALTRRRLGTPSVYDYHRESNLTSTVV